MELIEEAVKKAIRDVPDFPKAGIVFKDITTLLQNPGLSKSVLTALCKHASDCKPDVVLGIDSRGFIYGNTIAVDVGIPFAPVRKKGKLPADTISEQYELEYGVAELELHKDAFKPGDRVLIHDDLLATGGTLKATKSLVEQLGGVVVGVSFIVELSFLNGRDKILDDSINLFSVVTY